MQLTKHFAREEFEKDGKMPDEAVAICTSMCQLLEEIRSAFSSEPYIITSGYRPPDVNVGAGGVSDSEHVYTANQCACDGYFVDHHINMRPVFDWIRMNPHLYFDQVILEHGVAGDVIHIGIRYKNGRREALEGKTAGESAYQSWDVVPFSEQGMSA